jgi:hypothetical protein
VAKAKIKRFLADDLHLKLSDDKTRITHVNDGVDFLGFHIQRVRPEGRRVVHLRPTAEATGRVRAKIKCLTTRSWGWLDEYTRLTTLNWAVRNWANCYRFTSLQTDIEEVTRYTVHPGIGISAGSARSTRAADHANSSGPRRDGSTGGRVSSPRSGRGSRTCMS